MKRILLITTVFFLGQGCSIIRPYIYEICVKEPGQESHLQKNELTGIADTTVVNVSGQILDRNTSEVIFYAVSILRNEASNASAEQVVDSLGQFYFTVNPGQYSFKVKCIGYTELDTTLNLRSGETRNLTVTLGEAGAFTMYQIESRKKLSDEELNEAARELRK